jgi:hypothetical protein
VVRQIDALLGRRRRISFLVEAVEKELTHIRKFKAIEAAQGRDLNRRDAKRFKELQQLPTIHLGTAMLGAYAFHNLLTESGTGKGRAKGRME